MTKINPQLGVFSDEALINEITRRKYGVAAVPEMKTLFNISNEEIRQIYDALVDAAFNEHDINTTKYAPLIAKFFKMICILGLNK